MPDNDVMPGIKQQFIKEFQNENGTLMTSF